MSNDFWEGYVPEPVKPAQQALDKKAENARELGLDYEPEQEHAEQMAKLGWQYFKCPACGSEGAKAFPKPEQEPVGVFREDDDIGHVDLIPHKQMKFKDGDKFYASPPSQRTWVGLTAKDWNVIGFTAEFRAGAEWANDKLKEKNT